MTIDDPTIWSRPWTLMIPLKQTGENMFEFACHEGNYGLRAILSGARAQDDRPGDHRSASVRREAINETVSERRAQGRLTAATRPMR